jgi:diacylglycerol O-acyltransferase / wax synthase
MARVREAGAMCEAVRRHSPAPTVLSGTPGVEKRAVWSGAYPLDDLKRVGHLAGATLNDVLLSAVAGALCRYLVVQGGQPTDLATMVPVNIRPPAAELPPELGNRFALVLVRLPSGTVAPLERLAETKRRMDEIKRSPEAMLTFGMITAMGVTGAELERQLVDFFANKAIGVTTNVPGPTTTRYLAGTRVTGALGWAPESGDQTLGVCIFTYDGTVRVGFKADADRVQEPEKLLYAFDHEVDDLVHLVAGP